jgi:glyoxylase-like metal-dependent hydrolase (beta-lactamase superfamily II)
MRLLVLFVAAAIAASAQNAQQGVPENALMRVSEHVHAIVGFPNIAIVSGSRATLVVDTGMGQRNGAVIVRELAKLPHTPVLYLTTTHFHPEHATGEQAFPAGTVLIRPSAQQQELEKRGAEFIEMFSSRSEQNKELLKDVHLRKPDIVFDKETTLDLGGVTGRLMWLGPAHTIGDEIIFVKEDSVLIPGDIVQSKLVPNMPNSDANVKNWLAILDQLAALKPSYIVPDHGALGDGSLIAQEKAFLGALQQRALELKRAGTPVEQAAQTLTVEFKAKYPDWQNMNPVGNVVRRVYEEAQ